MIVVVVVAFNVVACGRRVLELLLASGQCSGRDGRGNEQEAPKRNKRETHNRRRRSKVAGWAIDSFDGIKQVPRLPMCSFSRSRLALQPRHSPRAMMKFNESPTYLWQPKALQWARVVGPQLLCV